MSNPVGKESDMTGIGSSSSVADYQSEGASKEVDMQEVVMIEKPIYSCKVNGLRPGTTGHTLTVKVLKSTPISTASLPEAECLVGDDTAVILFTARGSQVHLMKAGTTVVLRNARISLLKGSMRLSVDMQRLDTENTDPNAKHIQLVKLPPDHDFDVHMENNLSVIEFEVFTLDSLIDCQF